MEIYPVLERPLQEVVGEEPVEHLLLVAFRLLLLLFQGLPVQPVLPQPLRGVHHQHRVLRVVAVQRLLRPGLLVVPVCVLAHPRYPEDPVAHLPQEVRVCGQARQRGRPWGSEYLRKWVPR